MTKKFITNSIFVFLVTSFSYGQLSIRNNTHVFINDEIVYVENDINLNEADSKIYLRNDAQIIQGSGSTGNSGIGELSVYQEGNVGEYEYNYWCSPVGSKTNNTINNPFGISFLNDVDDLTISIPATSVHSSNYNGTSSPLNIEPYWIWKYIAGSTYADWIHVQANTTINAGEGFTMKGVVGTTTQQYDFRGKPNKGTMGVEVKTGKRTLVGNPYPSAIDALKYIHDSDNASVINGTLYYWEQDPNINSHKLADYQGGYSYYSIDISGTVISDLPATFSTYNPDGTIKVADVGNNGTKTPKRYIPIGQGFMVEGVADGFVKAKNSHRVYIKESDPDSEFFKTTNTKTQKTTVNNNGFSSIPLEYKRFRVNIDFNNTYTRQIAQTFHESATSGFDYGLECIINPSEILKSDAYWGADNQTFVAQAFPFEKSLKIPLNIKVSTNMPVTIRIADVQNFENVSKIYLHDIETNAYVDLTKENFSTNLATGIYKNRFEITFEKNTLNNNVVDFETLTIFQNNKISELIINNPNEITIDYVELIDINGKLVFRNKLAREKKSTHSTKSLSDGVYIVSLILENNQVFNKKIVITNKK